MDKKDKGSGNGCSIKVEGEDLVELGWEVGDSLFGAGTAVSDDPQIRR